MPESTTTHQTHPLRMLITAGPTQEPIDAVRYIGNRSSGRLGCSLADAAARAGYRVTLLLGPTPIEPEHPDVDTRQFRTTEELRTLLAQHTPRADVLVMAAAVADYRPAQSEVDLTGKRRRKDDDLVIRLESTPDLLAERASARREDQLFVGFALEPADRLEESARGKLGRKGIDLIVANPLETMDAEGIEATVYGTPDTGLEAGRSTPGRVSKADFAPWLLAVLEGVLPRFVGRLSARA